MVSRDRERAERCFALARSTTFDGERETAIARGVAIADKAGLDLDTFDIPGRAKVRRAPGQAFAEAERRRREAGSNMYGRFHEYGSPDSARGRSFWSEGYAASAADLAATMARFQEVMRRQQAAADAAAAQMRATGMSRDELMARQLRRKRQRIRWPSTSDAASFLFSRGVPVYDMGDPEDDGPRWYAPGRTPDRLDDDALRELADEVGA